MGDTQDKSDAYAALDQSEVDDYLAEIMSKNPDEIACDVNNEPYEKLLNRKRKWTPVQTTKGKIKDGAEEAVYRALSVRNMEYQLARLYLNSLSEIPEKSRKFWNQT